MSRLAVALVLCIVLQAAGTALSDNIKVYGDRLRHPKYNKQYARSYVTLPVDHDSTTAPLAVGLEMTWNFVKKSDELPLHSMIIDGGFNLTSMEADIQLPKVAANPFNWVFFGYNLHGHPPVGVYDTPHYDIHFFFPTKEAWRTIFNPTTLGPCLGATPATFFEAEKPVPKQCFPKGGYAHIGNFVPGHGNHLFPLNAPEFNPPRTFNQTLIFGTYGGENTFMEPMVTQAMILSKKSKCYDITDLIPDHYKTDRYIPTEYCIKPAKNSWAVEFRKFKMVTAGCDSGELVGYWPAGQANVPPLPAGCTVPTPTSG